MQHIHTVWLIIIAIVLSVVAAFFLAMSNVQEQEKILAISNFEECAAAGYPIMESYPEQCATPDGRTFARDISNDTPSSGGPYVASGCAVAGCSGQLCVSADEANDIITTCEFRAEYACYRQARCEPQADEKCGWTQTGELTQCLANPPALESSVELQPM